MILHPEPDGDRREMALRAPHPSLAAYVKGYCGYFERASGLIRRLKVPSGNVAVILGFGPALGVAYPGEGAGSIRHLGSFVAGLHEGPALVEANGWQAGVQIDLTVLGACALLRVPMHTLANRVVELDAIPGFPPRLAEQLQETAGWPARFDRLDSEIAARVVGARASSPAITWTLRRLFETDGRLAIHAIAAETRSSRQYLFNRFREEVGLPPKTFARILRFQGALRAIERNPEWHLAEIAHACGYYDQAHFNRDFRDFSGITPSDFLARRLPDAGGVRCA